MVYSEFADYTQDVFLRGGGDSKLLQRSHSVCSLRTKTTVKQTIQKYGREIGKEIAESAAETYAQAVVQAGTKGEFDPEILAGIDPTGIASIVVAYAKPVCTPPADSAPIMTRSSSSGAAAVTPTSQTVAWAAYPPIPANAVVGGKHRSGPDMQVCRADMGDGMHPGKVWAGKCNVGWGGRERVMSNFEVLIPK